MSQFARAIQDEIAALQKELGNDPRYAKLQKLMGLLDLYLGDEQAREEHPKPPRAPSRRAPSEKNQRILKTAADILAGRENPTSTADLLFELEIHGIEVHGNNPRNTLSAMLSKAEKFASHGRAGWTLEERPKMAETADENPGRNPSAASSDPRPTSGGTQSGPVNPWPGGGA